MARSIKKKLFGMSDGFQPELIQNALLDGCLGVPVIEKEKTIIIPDCVVPYSEIKKCNESNKFGCFHEKDVNFSEVISNPQNEEIINTLKTCSGVITPDCSVDISAPLYIQMLSICRSRSVGAFFQGLGIYTIANVRWGGRATYTTEVLPEPVAFLGVPKRSIVSIGSYGTVKDRAKKKCFRDGLIAMLDYLEPRVVLVYGAMPKEVFGDLLDRAEFVQYDNWTKVCHRRRNGRD